MVYYPLVLQTSSPVTDAIYYTIRGMRLMPDAYLHKMTNERHQLFSAPQPTELFLF